MFRAGGAAALLAVVLSATAGADPAVFPADKIDRLVLSDAELDEISLKDDPQYGGNYAHNAPNAKPPIETTPGGTPCENASWIGVPATLGSGWAAFREVFYHSPGGPNNSGVSTVAVVYPDAGAAEQAFARIRDGLKACDARSASVTTLGTGSVRWLRSFYYAPGGVDSQTYDEARLIGNVVLEVESEGKFQNPGPAVTAVADRIAASVR